jgi:hypothetical protein
MHNFKETLLHNFSTVKLKFTKEQEEKKLHRKEKRGKVFQRVEFFLLRFLSTFSAVHHCTEKNICHSFLFKCHWIKTYYSHIVVLGNVGMFNNVLFDN